MYAGQTWSWNEQVNDNVAATVDSRVPLYLAFFSSDKGPEKLMRLNGDAFFKLYGNTADFYKHGQPLLQAHSIANAGGTILAKRLVAEDATLANLIIAANVTEKVVNKLDGSGNQLYIDPDTGEETTTQSDTPATITSAEVKIVPYAMEDCKDFETLLTEAEGKLDDATGIYPLIAIADNGRGSSIKKVKIAADYTTSKNLNFCIYNMVNTENNITSESVAFSMNPDIIYLSTNMGLRNGVMSQLQTSYVEDGLSKMVAKLSEITGYSTQYLMDNDILFGKTTRGVSLDKITYTADSLDLKAPFGIALQHGKNGKFGDAPFYGTEAKAEYNKQALDFLDGKFDDAIFDVDLYKLDLMFDANYDDVVKDGMTKLANFREDTMLFRDLTTSVFSYNDIADKMSRESLVKTKFAADYLTTYEIVDPYSRKQIRVSMLYSLAPMMVAHFENGRNRPLAGEINNMVIKNAIQGTLNFAPRITPYVNQKELLDDLHVNFANYTDDKLVIQSLYTSKDKLGPLSYISNVLASQEVVKAIRTYCPKIRFQFQTGSDFGVYKTNVDSLLLNYTANFNSIELVYTADPIATAQKIFVASLKITYKNFVQSEKFNLYAIENYGTTTTTV